MRSVKIIEIDEQLFSKDYSTIENFIKKKIILKTEMESLKYSIYTIIKKPIIRLFMLIAVVKSLNILLLWVEST